MSGSVKQLFSFLLFAGLIGAVLVLRRPSTGAVVDAKKLDAEESVTRYGFHFREVSKESGVDFIHQAPTLDPKLDHIMPIIASMGAGVSIVDYDRDGLSDVYVVNSGEGTKNRLYHNQGDGTFKDVAGEMGVADLNQPGTGVCMGAVWGDFDNDGYEDLFVYRWGRPELFHNDKGKGFSKVAESAGLPKWVNANSAIWVDFDRDGLLDLFLAGYWADDVDLWHLSKTTVMPDSFEYAKNGGRKYLLRNRGDGTFEDVAQQMGVTSTRWTLAVAAGALCGDGFPDLFLANDYGVSELYANQGGKKFIEIGERAGIGRKPKSGMNACFGDVFNQGRFSIYVSNISEPKNLIQGNNLWVPEEGYSGSEVRYMNQANGLGVELGGWSWGSQFGDLNNDGLLDLYLTNGYVSGDRNKDNYWYSYSKIASANQAIIVDAKNWPKMEGRSLAGYQQKCVWLNKGGKFVDVAQAVGVNDVHDGRSVALADFWNRGALDVVVGNQKGPLLLYKNSVTPENQWVQFELEGVASNRSAIGARLRLYWNEQEQVQEVSGGSGYASQNQRRLHFGLGKDPRIEKAVVEWPSGRKQTLTAPRAGVLHKIREPQ